MIRRTLPLALVGAALVGVSLVGVALVGCRRESPTRARAVAARPSAGASAASAAPDGDYVSWRAPLDWTAVPVESPVRRGTWRVPHAPEDADDGECVALAYPLGSGAPNEVFDRWVAEFGGGQPIDVRRSERVAGAGQPTIEVRGTWVPPHVPGRDRADAKADWALLGVAIETVAGPRFFRLTGPAATVARASGPFWSMVASVRVEPR
jgi:hypothetical protein